MKVPAVVICLVASVLCGHGADKAQVFYAIEQSALGPGRRVDAPVVRRMVDNLVCRVTGKPDAASAWRSLVSPKDVVGIKVSTTGRALSGTNPEVAAAIAAGLRAAGVPKKNIIVWDRNIEDLTAAGYRADSADYTLRAIDPQGGYDPHTQVSAPVLGKLIWGDRKFGNTDGFRFADMLSSGEQLSSQSFYSKILTGEVTKIINVPSLTDSYFTGVNGAMANLTLGNLDNWRRFTKAPDHGDPYIAEIYADPIVREKVVLTLLDGLVLQYAGGPFPNPNFAIDNLALFASRDPVAIDATAMRLVNEARAAARLPSVKDLSGHIESAHALGLGEFAESRIDLVRVGVEGFR